MKKILILSLVMISTIMLAGCSSNQENQGIISPSVGLTPEQSAQFQTSKTVSSTDNLFAKKQECEKYSNAIIQSMNKAGGEEPIIFYSPRLNTCVYGWRTYDMTDPKAAAPDSIYFLADVLTKQNLYYGRSDHPERDAKIQELQGE